VSVLFELDIPSISAIIAAVGVLIGVVLTVLEVRNLVETRQTDLVIRLYSTFGSNELQDAWEKTQTREYKDFNAYKTEYGLREVNEVGWFFEGVGILLHRKHIDIGLVDDLFSSPVKRAWEKLKPIAEGERNQTQRPQIWEWFEYLYNEMQKREQEFQQRGMKNA
jgi:hypothetical protein